jgi:hypothetical protein
MVDALTRLQVLRTIAAWAAWRSRFDIRIPVIAEAMPPRLEVSMRDALVISWRGCIRHP